MKKTFFIILFASLAMAGQAQEKAEKFKTAKIKTSAVCDMCKRTMEKNLIFEKGIRSVDLDVETKVLTVEYRDGKTDVAAIKKAINKLGYDADEEEAPKEAYDKLHQCCKKDAH